MKQAVEREAKLRVPEDFELADIIDRLPCPSALRSEPRILETTYFDTDDLRLARAGLSVRFRQGDGTGWTVKLPEGSDGPALVRREVLFEGEAGDIPAPVSSLVLAHRRQRPLVPVGHLRTTRSEVELLDGNGVVQGRIVDDEVVVEGAEGGVSGLFREVEVELEPGAETQLLDQVVAILEAGGAQHSAVRSKIATALGPTARAAPDVVVSTLPRRPTAGQVAHAAVATSVRQLLRHDPGVRIGDDPEDVHQARVATRRLRSDLRTFAAILDRATVTRLRDELGWLADALGRVRDSDVLAERLTAHARQLPDRDATALASLLRRLTGEQEQARADLLEAMSSERYLVLLDDLVRTAAEPPLAVGHRRVAIKVLPKLIAPSWARLSKAVDRAGEDAEGEDLHAIRILAKRCRYACEAAAPVLGRPARRLAAAAAGVQTALGDYQDALVAEAWLREGAHEGAEALVAGELIAIQRNEALVARSRWTGAWKRARRLRPDKWLA